MYPSGKICIHACRRDLYAEGAGIVSVPLVEYVSEASENGSRISGEERRIDGFEAASVERPIGSRIEKG